MHARHSTGSARHVKNRSGEPNNGQLKMPSDKSWSMNLSTLKENECDTIATTKWNIFIPRSYDRQAVLRQSDIRLSKNTMSGPNAY